jgi:hypothetical protein
MTLSAAVPMVPQVSQNWTAQWGVPSLTLNPGATGSATLKVTASASAPPGAYAVGATSSNATSGLRAAALATDTIVSNLSVIVWPDAASYTAGKVVYICADVLAGPSLLASAKVTITLKRPDGTTMKSWSANTDASGVAKVSVNLGPAPRPGTYSITAAASKNGLAGSASSTFVVQ